MRKLIGTIVIIAIIVVGFTGVNLSVNGHNLTIKPFIKELIEDDSKREELKEKAQETAEATRKAVRTTVEIIND